MNLSRRTYLRAMGLLSTVSVGSLSSGSAAAAASADSQWGEPVPTGSTRVAVDDPHITIGHGMSYTYGTDAGIPNLSRAELAREVLKLHPDFWNQRYITAMSGDPFESRTSVPQTARDGIDLAASLNLAASLGFGWTPYDVPLDERPATHQMSGYLYDLSPDEQWPAPDGSPADHPLHESTARDIDGNVRPYMEWGDTAAYDVSLYAPGPTEYHLRNNENAPLYGANATEMDMASDASNLMTGDFSVWGQRAFRDYLQELPADRLDRLDIDDISTFNIQSYARHLREEAFAGHLSPDDVIRDPVLFEFRLMENRRILEFYQTYTERGHGSADRVDSPFTTLGNQGTRIVSTKSTAAIVLSRAFDLIEVENPVTNPDREPAMGGYLSSYRTAVHKLVAAMKQTVDKPAVEHGFYGTGGWEGTLDPTKRYPTLQTLNFAEVFANGSTRQLDLDGWNGLPPDSVALMWLDSETGSVPDDIRPLADFLWLYERDLRGTPRSDVAVVYSIPTLLGRLRPFIGRRGDLEAKRMDGWARAARERQIPTDVVIFGHPELWDDSDALERLSSYQTLIFPFADALTDAQADALREFVNGGGTVLFEDALGTHDGYYRPRAEDLTDIDGVIDVTGAGAPATNGDVSRAGDAIESSLQSPLVEVEAPATLSCEVVEAEDGWTSVHLVNYDYDADTDSISPVTDIDVSLHDPEGLTQDVDFVAPDADPVSLTAQQDGEYVSVTVPKVAVWGIVRFKTGTRTQKTSESAAESAIETASDALDSVSATGRSLPMTIGEAAMYEANLAKAAGQYDRAVERASIAESQTTPARKELTVGIDSGHGQDPARTYDGLGKFRSKYETKYGISFSEVTKFTPEQLAGLDGLLIGPALQKYDEQFTFSDDELATLERFVDAGGRVAVVACESVDDGINRVTERFDITVDPRKIHTLDNENENAIQTEPVEHHTPFTYQVLEQGWMPRACSLTNLGADVEVQIQSKPNTVRAGGSEQKPYPVCAVSRRGAGAVVVSSSDELLSQLQWGPEVQARNILRFIGDTETTIEATDLTPEPQTTTTTTGSGADAGSATSTTSASGPGFGLISALTGFLGAVIYAMYREEEPEE